MTKSQDFWHQAEIWSRHVNDFNMEVWHGAPLPCGPVARIRLFVRMLRDAPDSDLIRQYKIGAMIKKECNKRRMLKSR